MESQLRHLPLHVVLSMILLIILANLPAQIQTRRQIHPRGSHTRDFTGPGDFAPNRRIRDGWLSTRETPAPSPPDPPYRGDIPITSTDSDSELPAEKEYTDEYLRAIYGVSRESYQNGDECTEGPCHPRYGNLLIGRQHLLRASSTCGLNRSVRYCLVSHGNETKCEYCNSKNNNINSHDVSKISDMTTKDTWWQAENGKQNVTIEFNLDAEFHIMFIIIRFRTFVPAAMYIERSYDFGKTWQVYQYFAHDCALEFPGILKFPPTALNQVVCTEQYSKMTPTRDGKVLLRPLSTYRNHLSNRSPHSNEVLNLVKATNIRLKLLKLHTLGNDKLDTSAETAEKYYFAINGMNIGGMCSCYGHASQCIPAPGEEDIPEMVYGLCKCSHNTQGKNCEKCLDFYNDVPWRPAIVNETSNACKKCECNEHATACHFDEAVYIESGNRSGGVCEGCLHNTAGKNCQFCMPFFYRDPNRDLTDPLVCKQCDCEPAGSLENGDCDGHTDLLHGLQAGRCRCKQNVQGSRCDTCKHGHWNFNESNPQGCDGCNCSPHGTRNGSCDAATGFCVCKRFVEGRECTQCLKGYWGLAPNHDNGCQPCDCGPGSVDEMCDTITGQCKCWGHMTGRTCSQPSQGYYIPMPYITKEAEEAEFSKDCYEMPTQPDYDEETLWTRTKTVRCPTRNATVTFRIDHVPKSTTYDIVIRYKTSLKSSSSATIVVHGEGPHDNNGPCPKMWNTEEDAVISLNGDSNSANVHRVCLDRGKTYKIRLSFKEHAKSGSNSVATTLINIDSIVLIPQIPSQITEHFGELANNCAQFIKQNPDDDKVRPESCDDVFTKWSTMIHEGAQSCSCDKTGSTSLICSPLGGHCSCKSNVEGRQCDRCAPQHYGFSPAGCQACDCDHRGSLDGQCAVDTGQCKCRPGVYGAKCDQCQPGFWNFPNCQRCECNGHAAECNQEDGACLYCQNNTTGQFCDKCVDGFYGDPRLNVQLACRPCPCPGTADSGHIFGKKCALGAGDDVICECEPGYTGARCNKCADNFYGNPEVPGGSCKVCDCNNKIDITKPGSCDSRTGECKNCLFNSEGPHCEFCQDGYYEDELGYCSECVCALLGTISSRPCNKTSGQCDCLPNAVGLKCDSCRENHWKLVSGTGCEPCNCDPDGAISAKCNEYDGQCECKTGLGGRKCDQCPPNHWGNPKINCRKCECDADGSAAHQCNRDDGSCNCLSGISGYNCNECARGYNGTVPQCKPCGECFRSWDLTLAELRDRTFHLLHNLSEMNETEVSGAYSHDFNTLSKRVTDVKRTLERETTPGQLEQLQRTVDRIRDDMNIVATEQLEVEQISRNVSERILFSKLSISDLERKLASLRGSLNTLRRNATRLQESNVHGALNLIKDASQRSVNAHNQAKSYQKMSQEAEKQCIQAESMMDTTVGMEFTTKQDENTRTLTEAQRKLDRLQERLPDINDLVCSDRGNPCSDLCGGGGCDTCGGLSCDGAVDKAKHALKYAQEADKLIREKDAKGDLLLREVIAVMEESERSLKLAQDAVQNVSKIGEASRRALAEHGELADRADAFLKKSQPANLIRAKMSELQLKTIPFEPEEILDLARNINETIKSLTDIDSILEESHDDKQTANKLRHDAETTREAALKMANTSQTVVNALKKAQEAQETAEIAVQNATTDVETVGRLLPQIIKMTNDAHTRTNETLEEVKQLESSQKHLQSRFLKTSGDVKEMMVEATLVERDSEIAMEGANRLRIEHEQVLTRIEQEAYSYNETRIEADRLLERAANFSFHVNSQLRQLQDMEISYVEYGKTAAALSDEVEQLTKTVNSYLSDIIEKSRYYHSCMS